MFTRTLTCIALACVVAGCMTTPTVDWRAGKPDAALQPAPDGSLYTMQRSLAAADQQIADLQAKKREFTDRSTQNSNMALGLGLLTAGAALGKAHRDVLTTGAFAGGSLYLADTLNSTKARMDVYNAGITATMCAKKAVSSAAAISTSSFGDRTSQVQTLNRALVRLQVAIAAADIALNEQNIPRTELKKKYDEQLQDAVTAKGKAEAALDVFTEFRRQQQQGAKTLWESLQDIRNKVDVLTEQSISDVKQVFASLPGLYSAMDSAAPGLDLGAAAKKAIDDSRKKLLSTDSASDTPGHTPAAPAGGASSPLANNQLFSLVEKSLNSQKSQRLIAATRKAVDERTSIESVLAKPFAELAAASAEVSAGSRELESALPPKGSTSVPPEQLKECGVSDTVLALKIDVPADAAVTVKLVKDKDAPDSYVQLSGGIKPYRWLKSQDQSAVRLEQANPQDSSMTLKVSKDANPADYTLVIQDSSQSPRTAQLKVTVQPADAGK